VRESSTKPAILYRAAWVSTHTSAEKVYTISNWEVRKKSARASSVTDNKRGFLAERRLWQHLKHRTCREALTRVPSNLSRVRAQQLCLKQTSALTTVRLHLNTFPHRIQTLKSVTDVERSSSVSFCVSFRRYLEEIHTITTVGSPKTCTST
jgi:hypothetical protein